MVRASPKTLPYQEFFPHNASYLNSFRNYRSNPNKENLKKFSLLGFERKAM
jgi:hypothetical protein